MAAIALIARPRLFDAGMLFGLTVALGLATAPDPQPAEAHIELGSWERPFADDSIVVRVPPAWLGLAPIPPSRDSVVPAWTADAQDWPRGMVIGRGAVARMDATVVAHWLSGFLSWLASGPA